MGLTPLVNNFYIFYFCLRSFLEELGFILIFLQAKDCELLIEGRNSEDNATQILFVGDSTQIAVLQVCVDSTFF